MRPERAAGRRIIAPRINYVALGTKRTSASVGHEVLRPGELGWLSDPLRLLGLLRGFTNAVLG